MAPPVQEEEELWPVEAHKPASWTSALRPSDPAAGGWHFSEDLTPDRPQMLGSLLNMVCNLKVAPRQITFCPNN